MGENLPFRLILASASPARSYLLGRAAYTFDVIPSHIDEPTQADYPDCQTLVAHIAWLKAKAVAMTIAADESRPAVVLAADTVGWHAGQVIGKPADAEDARRIISTLSGTTHELWTGVCLWRRPGDLQFAFQEKSLVAMRALGEDELNAYIASGAWDGHSGGYAIKEDGDDPFLKVVKGDITNVIGLPMETLEHCLERLKRL